MIPPEQALGLRLAEERLAARSARERYGLNPRRSLGTSVEVRHARVEAIEQVVSMLEPALRQTIVAIADAEIRRRFV